MANATPAPASRRDLEARIVANAWRDPKYKKALLDDPKAVLEHELKKVDPTITLPADLKVNVHEEDPNTFHLVLPRDPRELTLGDILPDGALEAVAPQTVAVVVAVVGIGVVAGNCMGVVNNVGAGNTVAAGNTATVGNLVATANAVA